MKTNKLKPLCLAIIFSVFFMPLGIIAEDFIEDLKEVYNFEQWVGTTKTNYQNTVSDFQPNFNEITFTPLYLNNCEILQNGVNRRYFAAHTTQTNMFLDVRILCRNNVVDAQNAMMEFFSLCSAIQPFPSGETMSVSVGDRCYLGCETNSIPSISFVRNTVFVHMSIDGVTNSVLPIAVWLDNLIMDSSF